VSPFLLRVFTEPLDEAFESDIITIKVASLEKRNGNYNLIISSIFDKFSNVAIDDLAVKPYIPHKSLLQ